MNVELLENIFNALAVLLFIVYWAFVFVILYHLTRFGIGVQPKRFAAIFFLGSVVLSGMAVIFFTRVDISAIIKLITL